MQDLYKGFKKVAEDDNSATLKHENGHELNIAKSGLSRKHKVQLEKLPLHQADGTELGNEKTDELLREMEAAKAGQALPQEPQMSGEPFQPTNEQLNQPQESFARQFGKSVREKDIIPAYEDVKEYANAIRSAAKKYVVSPIASAAEAYNQATGAIEQGAGEFLKGVAGVEGQIPPSKLQLRNQEQRQVAEQQKSAETAQKELELEEAKVLGLSADKPLATEQQVPTQDPEQILQQQAAATPEITKKSIDLTRPLNAPIALRTPEEVIVDPSVSETERAQALVMAAQNIQTQIQKSNQDFQEEMRKPENQINMDRFYSNMSTGRKIRTIIGMLLGGMAGGILRQENPLIAMLNKEIDRDIESQKLAREDKTNLYKQNLQILKDSQAAYIQTANQLRTIVEMKMLDAQRKLDPNNMLGKTALQAGISENQRKVRENDAVLAKIALKEKFNQARQKGQFIEMPDEIDDRLDSAVRVTDAKGRSVKFYARNKGAVQELQKRADAISNAENLLARIIGFNKQHGREFGMMGVDTEYYNVAQALNDEAKIVMANLLSSGTVSERNAKLFDGLLPTAGAFKQGDAQRQAVNAARLLLGQKKTLIEGNLTR